MPISVLHPRAHALGLASDERLERVLQKIAHAKALVRALKAESIRPEAANAVIVPRGTSPLKQKVKLFEIAPPTSAELRRSGATWHRDWKA